MINNYNLSFKKDDYLKIINGPYSGSILKAKSELKKGEGPLGGMFFEWVYATDQRIYFAEVGIKCTKVADAWGMEVISKEEGKRAEQKGNKIKSLLKQIKELEKELGQK